MLVHREMTAFSVRAQDYQAPISKSSKRAKHARVPSISALPDPLKYRHPFSHSINKQISRAYILSDAEHGKKRTHEQSHLIYISLLETYITDTRLQQRCSLCRHCKLSDGRYVRAQSNCFALVDSLYCLAISRSAV